MKGQINNCLPTKVKCKKPLNKSEYILYYHESLTKSQIHVNYWYTVYCFYSIPCPAMQFYIQYLKDVNILNSSEYKPKL